MQHLQPNTTLQGGKYRIERVLGQGGFGNTYVGVNTVFNERVAIKEFFMRGVSLREGDQVTVSVSVPENKESFLQQKEKFKKEALRIRQLKNEHIVAVHDMFEENGTAYYVMDYVDGQNLAERLKITGKPIKEQDVRYILPQILDALKAVHNAGFWHLDLKPANIMLERGGIIKLIDFGASKQLNAQKGGATTSTAISYTNGYAPREQMEQNYDKFGPWTDIYAIGATLYNLLTNKRPPLPTDIDDDMSEDKHLALPFPEGVSDGMKYCVLWMMKTNRLQRPQSIDEIIKAEKDRKDTPKISAAPKRSKKIVTPDDEETIIAEPQPKPGGRKTNIPPTVDNSSTEEKSDSLVFDNEQPRKGGYILFAFIVIGIVVCIFIGGFVYESCDSNASQNVEPTDSSTSQVDVTTPKKVYSMQYQTAIGSCEYTGPVDEDNRPHGTGEAYFTDGRYYKGGFEHGNMSGLDCYFKYANGDKFDGVFRDNSFYVGSYTIAEDGSHFEGSYNNGQPSAGKWYDKNGKVIEEIHK